MVWKPKEKELTREEAIALAKKELAPCWFGSTPLLGAVKLGGRVSVHPLDDAFSEGSWLMYFIDPTRISGQSALVYAREFHRRYSPLDLKSALVVYPRYQFLRNPETIESLIRREQVAFPLVIDADGLLFSAFRVKQVPKLVLIGKGKTFLEREGKDWTQETELEIHRYLRAADAGLPLLPVYAPQEPSPQERGEMELGKKGKMRYPAPGFSRSVGVFAAAEFTGSRPEKMEAGQFFITGKWLQDAERIATSDPNAQIGFRSPTAALSVVAQSLANTQESAKLVIEVDGIPAYDVFGGEDLTFDDEGQSVVRVEGPRLYHPLAKLPAKNREITFRFPYADRAAIAIYGLRFSTRSTEPE